MFSLFTGTLLSGWFYASILKTLGNPNFEYRILLLILALIRKPVPTFRVQGVNHNAIVRGLGKRNVSRIIPAAIRSQQKQKRAAPWHHPHSHQNGLPGLSAFQQHACNAGQCTATNSAATDATDQGTNIHAAAGVARCCTRCTADK